MFERNKLVWCVVWRILKAKQYLLKCIHVVELICKTQKVKTVVNSAHSLTSTHRVSR